MVFMKKHLFAIWVNYTPNSAPSNRMLSYLDAWSKLNVEVTVVFVLPDRQFSKVPYQYSNITFKYLWESFPTKVRIAHYLLYGIYTRMFRNSLQTGDRVYVYGQANLLPFLRKRKDIELYHETTEHPSVITLGVKFHKTTFEKYIESCLSLDGVFVISSQLKQFFIKEGIDEDRVKIVNMTVDPNRFKGVLKRGVKDYIAYCGNATNNKDGVDKLIKSFALISERHPELLLYIIGQAPDQNEKFSNAQLANKLGIADRVVFTGTVSYDEMPQLLTDAKILALNRPDSLQAKYGFPTKLGEYLLTGNPVVITDTGDISLFLKDQESAMIADSQDDEDFAQKLDWLLEHPNEAAIIGKKGKEVALACLDSRFYF